MEKIWLKNYPPGMPPTIDADAYANINEMFTHFSQQYQEKLAFTNFNTSITYRQLFHYSHALAAYLQQELRLQKGDRVAIMLPNTLQYPISVFGVLLMGGVIVNINPLYTARELKYPLQDSGAKAIIVLENFVSQLEKILPETQLKHVIVSKIGDFLGIFKGAFYNIVNKYIKKVPSVQLPHVLHLKKIVRQGAQLRFNSLPISGEDLAFLQYTGGTTGIAKGAMLTHRNLVANIQQCHACLGSAEIKHEVILGALPFYHIFALTVCCLCFMMTGGNCLLITNPRDLKSLIAALCKMPVSIFIGLNTLFNALINHPDCHKIDFSTLRLTVAGGMATQAAVAEKWQQLTSGAIVEGYGLTEASPVVSMNPITNRAFNGSVGLPVSSTDIAIRNEQGVEVPIGEKGELWLKGPQVMKGYWHRKEETTQVLDANGWLRTGDIATMDKEGYLYIVDRQKDMILVSGFNVYPTEIEDVLASHPGIKEAAVVGVASPETGEMIKAFVVRNDMDLTDTQIIHFCRQNLTGYKIPKKIEFCSELPKSNVGKVLRRELRDK